MITRHFHQNRTSIFIKKMEILAEITGNAYSTKRIITVVS